MIFNNLKTKLTAMPRVRKLLYPALFLVLFFLGITTYLYFKPKYIDLDTPLKIALLSIPSIDTYSQYVETETEVSGRTLKIVGSYDVDSKNKRFAAYSTTTLIIKGEQKGHVFTLQNISIGDDIYTKIETADPLLKSSIQSSATWRHFKNDVIPESFIGIAVSGPIQDNLQILSDNGSWITLVKKVGVEEFNHIPTLHYVFKLSNRTPPQDGALSAMLSRIGTGTIDVWLHPQTYEPLFLRFENYPYLSTTTILYTNTPLLIEVPNLSTS